MKKRERERERDDTKSGRSGSIRVANDSKTIDKHFNRIEIEAEVQEGLYIYTPLYDTHTLHHPSPPHHRIPSYQYHTKKSPSLHQSKPATRILALRSNQLPSEFKLHLAKTQLPQNQYLHIYKPNSYHFISSSNHQNTQSIIIKDPKRFPSSLSSSSSIALKAEVDQPFRSVLSKKWNQIKAVEG